MMDEKCVMNSYFGIGIDAKITLDFHMKREEHPEKCRSRARNYMWYGVLGSKEWLQVRKGGGGYYFPPVTFLVVVVESAILFDFLI